MSTSTSKLYEPGVWHQLDKSRMVDIRKGGQFGWHADFSGIVNSTPHTSSPLICRVLASPRGFNKLPAHREAWHQSWKALFELHAKTITGLNKTLQPNWGDTPFGGSGETLEVPTGMTRSKSSVTFSFTEKYGLPITRMVEAYHRMFLYDEDTMHPGIAMVAKEEDALDGLMDFYTWTMIFIEPARYLEQANRTWIINNMGIKTSATQESKRDKGSDNELVEFDLEMTGTAQVGWHVDAIGNAILRAMKKTQTDPMRAPAFINGVRATDGKNADSGLFHFGDLDGTSGFLEDMQRYSGEMVQAT